MRTNMMNLDVPPFDMPPKEDNRSVDGLACLAPGTRTLSLLHCAEVLPLLPLLAMSIRQVGQDNALVLPSLQSWPSWVRPFPPAAVHQSCGN